MRVSRAAGDLHFNLKATSFSCAAQEHTTYLPRSGGEDHNFHMKISYPSELLTRAVEEGNGARGGLQKRGESLIMAP